MKQTGSLEVCTSLPVGLTLDTPGPEFPPAPSGVPGSSSFPYFSSRFSVTSTAEQTVDVTSCRGQVGEEGEAGRGQPRLAWPGNWQRCSNSPQVIRCRAPPRPANKQRIRQPVKHPCKKNSQQPLWFFPHCDRFLHAASPSPGQEKTQKKNLCLQHLIRGGDGNQPRLMAKAKERGRG